MTQAPWSWRLLIRLYCVLSLARLRTGFPSAFAFLLAWQATAVPVSFLESVFNHPVLFFNGLLLSYFCGTVVNLGNSVSDIAEDEINLPHRVKMVRIYGLKRLLKTNNVMSYLMVALGVATLNLPLLFLTPFAVWFMNQYSFPPLRCKRRPFLSLVNFSGGIWAPFQFAYFMQVGEFAMPAPHVLWLWVLTSLWFGLFGTTKNLQDYEGDKAAGIVTTATLFQTKKQAVLFAAGGLVFSLFVFVLPVISGALPARLLVVLLWLLFIVPIMYLNNKNKDNPEKLRRLQSLFFMYPIFFLASLNLILFPSLELAAVVGILLVLLMICEKLAIDSRKPQCYANLQKMMERQQVRRQRKGAHFSG